MDSALAWFASLVGAAIAAAAVFLLAVLWTAANRRRVRRREVEARILAARTELAKVGRMFRVDLPVLFDGVISNLVLQTKLEAEQVLRNAGRAVDDAERSVRRSPKGSAEIMVEAERQIAIAEEMFHAIDEAVAESRSLTRRLLAELTELHARTLEQIHRRLDEGYPFHEAAVEVSLLAFGLLADKYAVDGDPLGVLCHMSETVSRLAVARYATDLRVALMEHVEEASKTLPARIEEAARLLPAVMNAIIALQGRRPDPRWNELLKAVQKFPALLDELRVKLAAIGVSRRSDEQKQREAFVGAVMAEASLAVVEGHVTAILDEWMGTCGSGDQSDHSRS